jgi:probable rRNA maturation factor
MIDFQQNTPLKQPFSETQIDALVASIIQEETKKSKGPLCLVFCDDEQLLKINQDHLNHDYFTDIITFDYSDEDTIVGDLLISLQRVQENARTFKTSYEKELLRVIIHGVLHLCGFNDKTYFEKILMRFKENVYLNTFVSRETLRSAR